MNKKLVLIRHGQSEWNLENRFTGWHDSPLTDKGKAEAAAAGKLLAQNELIPEVIHTSVLTRATETTELVLAELQSFEQSDKSKTPADISVKKSWELNERHYGNLTGKNKTEAVEEFGEEQVFEWRRKYSVRPPEITGDNIYAEAIAQKHIGIVPAESFPKTECLEDVSNRLLPYFENFIKPDLAGSSIILVSAHGNSLRALIKHLDNISDEEISELNLPTAIPLVYELNEDFAPAQKMEIAKRYLGDPEAAAKAAAEVANQTKKTN